MEEKILIIIKKNIKNELQHATVHRHYSKKILKYRGYIFRNSFSKVLGVDRNSSGFILGEKDFEKTRIYDITYSGRFFAHELLFPTIASVNQLSLCRGLSSSVSRFLELDRTLFGLWP